jgi:hypothetical protein
MYQTLIIYRKLRVPTVEGSILFTTRVFVQKRGTRLSRPFFWVMGVIFWDGYRKNGSYKIPCGDRSSLLPRVAMVAEVGGYSVL